MKSRNFPPSKIILQKYESLGVGCVRRLHTVLGTRTLSTPVFPDIIMYFIEQKRKE